MTKIVITERDKVLVSDTKSKLVDVLIDTARAVLRVTGDAICNIKLADKSTEIEKDKLIK
jgi:hypothetical protein